MTFSPSALNDSHDIFTAMMGLLLSALRIQVARRHEIESVRRCRPTCARTSLGVRLHARQALTPNQDDAGREYSPVPAEFSASGWIGGHDARLGGDNARVRAERVRAKCPHNL